MPLFEFYTRCNRSECAAIRELLEQWFEHYPDSHKDKLRSDFQADDANFHAAFWELYLHEYLDRLGYIVAVHPELGSRTRKRPDFRATSKRGDIVFIEAATTSPKSQWNTANRNRARTALASVENLDHPEFSVILSEEGVPDGMPSGRRIADGLRTWLDSLNLDECVSLAEKRQYDELPTWEIEQHGWKLQFQAIPYRSRQSGRSRQFILARHGSFNWIDAASSLRDSIKAKAVRYGKMGHPFVVAVNMRDSFLDETDIRNALFGEETVHYAVGPGMELKTWQARRLNGVWTDVSGVQNTRISAVLVGWSVNPHNVATASLKLYHNPWASLPYRGPLNDLTRLEPKDATMAEVEGIHPRSVFELGPDWPMSAA